MKIGVYPADVEGCGHYRLIWPAFALHEEGYDVEVIPPAQRGNSFSASIDEETDDVEGVKIPDKYDVIVFQRISNKYLAQAIPFIVRMGIGVVIDIDDDLESIHWSNPAFANLHPRSGQPGSLTAKHNWTWTRYAIDHASMVTVSSEALFQRYCRRRPETSAIIRNYVPEHYLAIQREQRLGHLVGWGGSMRAHFDDVPVLGDSVRRIIKAGFDFRVVGPPEGVRDALKLNAEPDHTGGVDLEHWPDALAQLDIGLAPLSDSRFNKSKSWLKPLEYAAVGVPCVMSPRDEYREIHKYGIGTLAAKPNEWYQAMKTLLTNDALREERSQRGREVVARHLTIQNNVHQWADVWTRTPFNPDRKRTLVPVMNGAIGVFRSNVPRKSAG